MTTEETLIPVVERGQTKHLSLSEFVYNLDTNLAGFLDLVLTHYNDTRKGYKGNSEEEWQDKILDIRDGFRRYRETEAPEWDDEFQDDFQKTMENFSEIYSGLWQ